MQIQHENKKIKKLLIEWCRPANLTSLRPATCDSSEGSDGCN